MTFEHPDPAATMALLQFAPGVPFDTLSFVNWQFSMTQKLLVQRITTAILAEVTLDT